MEHEEQMEQYDKESKLKVRSTNSCSWAYYNYATDGLSEEFLKDGACMEQDRGAICLNVFGGAYNKRLINNVKEREILCERWIAEYAWCHVGWAFFAFFKFSPKSTQANDTRLTELQ